MHSFGLTGKMITHAGQRDLLLQLLLTSAEALQAMEGCNVYIISISETEPDAIYITEVWTNAEAHQASLALAEIQAIIQVGRPMIASFESTKLQTLGGKGI